MFQLERTTPSNRAFSKLSSLDRTFPGYVFALLASTTLVALEAEAQQLDYGTYEELFGEVVTLGATGTPQRVSDVAADMVIITQEEIRRSDLHISCF